MYSVTKAFGDYTAVDADKKKKSSLTSPPPSQQRPKNRRSKQNLAAVAGEGSSPVNNQHYSDNALDIAFNSLPTIHIGCAVPLRGETGRAISRSCLMPNISSPLEGPTSNGSSPPTNLAKRKVFAPHWPEHAIEEAIEKGNAFRATFRVNVHNRQEAYCTIEGVSVDVLINGLDAQNRAIEGDVVAIMLDPVAYWTKLKGSNVPNNAVVADNSNMSPEAKEARKNCASQEHLDTNELPPVGREYHENGSTYESVQVYLQNRSDTTYINSDKRKHMAVENSNTGYFSKPDETSRSLSRINAMINSCPSKRPTGKVVAILRKSPRRGAVIGFLASKEEQGMQNDGQFLKRDNQIALSDMQLLPKDPKFPKMVVSLSGLPAFAKEKVIKGDMSLERELIAAQIEEWSDECHFPKARVINFLGRGVEIEPQIAAILFENSLYDSEFSLESLDCLPATPWKIPKVEFETRKDLRSICTFTIDPATAIDLDDALSVEIVSDDIFRIGVHIADVSYFIHPDTALDAEAQIRSTSVYMLQHKLSMLPPELSEGLCSLLPGVDRLTFSIIWDISPSGNIVGRWIGRSIIRSCCKLSYDDVQGIIDKSFVLDQGNPCGSTSSKLHGQFEWKDVINSLRTLYEISMRLRENRFKDGALWLDSSKIGFLFDECGAPCDSFLHERKESCFLVEELMLLANRSVAEVISLSFPDCALLRRHPEPNLRKLREFEAFWAKHGFQLDTSSSGQLQLSLSQIREKLKDDPMLFDILVSYASRPMQMAMYFCTGELRDRANDWGHYALSVPFYTHFTSPIRRYPDIIVHRTLAAAVDAEDAYLRKKQLLPCVNKEEESGTEVTSRCFTGLHFNRNAAESDEGKEALMAAALKFKIPGCEVLSEVAAYCNERKLASRHAEEAGEKLYLWTLLKKKEMLVSEARVLGLGPKFVSVYIHKFGIERRIYYDEVESLAVEWLETTSTLVLDLLKVKRPRKLYNWRKFRPVEDAALVVYPSEDNEAAERKEPSPAMFPLVLRLLSTVPVALHAIGGDDGPLDIGARLYTCSYFR